MTTRRIPNCHRRFATCIFAVLSLAFTVATAPAQVNAVVNHVLPVQIGEHSLELRYDTTHDLDEQHDSITLAVVMIHGTLRNGDQYHEWTVAAGRAANVLDTTAFVTPQFLMEVDVRAHELPEATAFWTDGGWKQGDLSLSTEDHPRPVRISSFAALEALLAQLPGAFPNVEEIVIAGHSAGGQYVNRFAAGNSFHHDLAEQGITARYIIANPSSYLYFCEHRPVLLDPDERENGNDAEDNDTNAEVPAAPNFAPYTADGDDGCSGFNRYRFGLDRLNDYMAAVGPEELARRYSSRRVTYLLSAEDNDPESRYLDRRCGAMLQGRHRFERGVNYFHYVAFRFGQEVHELHEMAVVRGVAHNARQTYGSAIGRRALFGTPVRRSSVDAN